MIFDEGIVVATVCVSIMDADCMKVIRVLLHLLIGLVDLRRYVFDLHLHLSDLV